MSTISAIATPHAVGGIAMIRISGEQAIPVAEKVFTTISKKPLSQFDGYRASFGLFAYKGKSLDEGIALVYRAPKSYTGEDVVELFCHGGLLVSKKILRAVYEAGAEPAQPGEFTKRAFINGKMDLTKAESIMDIIQASNDNGLKAASNAMEGALYGKISAVKDSLVSAAAHLGAWADYPEEEIEEVNTDELLQSLQESRLALQDLLNRYDQGQIIKDGVNTVIVGKPNAGKSTLMNLLTGYEKSIVTEVAGTTRDVVEERVNLGDVVLNLADTAGLRDTEDLVEKIGVDLAKKRIHSATLVLAVFDNSEPLTKEDEELMEATREMTAIAIINKTDLHGKLDVDRISSNYTNIVQISAQEGTGIDALRERIVELLGIAQLDMANPMLANERQRNCAVKAEEALRESIETIQAGYTLDAVTVTIEHAIESLLELTGERVLDTVLDEVFSRFCVGK